MDDGAPKVPPSELRKVVLASGLEVNSTRPDFGIVVGGDGVFSRYGRTQDIPLLFVGVRSKTATGSKAHLAEITYDELPEALFKVRKGGYSIVEHKRLGVFENRKSIGEVFTDVYLQRGSESGCIRYRVQISGPGLGIEEAAIGDGVVVTTQAGSTGYYSYPDRIKGELMDPDGFASLERNEVGICHINPTYVERKGTGGHPLRYTVPWGSRISMSLFRKADARLYGTTDRRAGVPVGIKDRITVAPGKRATRLITLSS